jgi:pimeloyl-ACP methyl ester carboxylesterase
MHAIDRFRHPRPESVLTSAELAAITAPTTFILGSDDPYLSVEHAQLSVGQIHGARLYEVPGGHAPWLVDAQRTAELIATRSHLAPGDRGIHRLVQRCPAARRSRIPAAPPSSRKPARSRR